MNSEGPANSLDEMSREALYSRIDELENQVDLLTGQTMLAGILKHSIVGVYRTTPDGRVIYANSRLVKMLGYESLDEIKAMDLDTDGYYPGFSRKAFTDIMEKNDCVVGMETGWKRKDGSLVFVKESAWVVRDERGEIVCYDGFCEDISQWKFTQSKAEEDLLKYKVLVECGNDGIIIIHNGRLIFVNNRILEMTGYSEQEAMDRHFWDFAPKNQRKALRRRYEMRIEGKSMPARYETAIMTSDGIELPVEINASLINLHDRVADMAIIRDISSRKKMETEIRESYLKIEKLHDVVPRLLEANSEDEVYTIAIAAAKDILNLDWCDISVREGEYLVPRVSSRNTPAQYSRRIRLDGSIAGKTVKTGNTFLVDDYSPTSDPAERLKSLISVPVPPDAVFQAFSENKSAFSRKDLHLAVILMGHVSSALEGIHLHRELQEQVIRDSLTGIYNRRYLHDEFRRERNRCERNGYPIALLMIDIDDFKEINDRFGHQAGDETLQAVAGMLKGSIRDCDAVIRYGGDEFLIVLPETSRKVVIVRDRIMDRVSRLVVDPVTNDRPITLSVGMAIWHPGEDRPFEDTIRLADQEMYRVKQEKQSI